VSPKTSFNFSSTFFHFKSPVLSEGSINFKKFRFFAKSFISSLVFQIAIKLAIIAPIEVQASS
jgi:hypothetical protein